MSLGAANTIFSLVFAYRDDKWFEGAFMLKKILIAIAVVVLLVIGYFVFIHDESETNEAYDSYHASNKMNTTQILGMVTQHIGGANLPDFEQHVLTGVIEYVDQFFDTNDVGGKAKNATYDYLKLRLDALYAPNIEQTKEYYTEAYRAMSCIAYFSANDTNHPPELLINTITDKLLADPVFKQKQESADISLSGSIFVDIPKVEKEKYCNEKYN